MIYFKRGFKWIFLFFPPEKHNGWYLKNAYPFHLVPFVLFDGFPSDYVLLLITVVPWAKTWQKNNNISALLTVAQEEKSDQVSKYSIIYLKFANITVVYIRCHKLLVTLDQVRLYQKKKNPEFIEFSEGEFYCLWIQLFIYERKMWHLAM